MALLNGKWKVENGKLIQFTVGCIYMHQKKEIVGQVSPDKNNKSAWVDTSPPTPAISGAGSPQGEGE